MTPSNAADILKGAILLERKGRAFYTTAASEARNADVKKFFEAMAAEEATHEEILSRQFSILAKEGRFAPAKLDAKADPSPVVMTESFRKEVGAAGFEAAAISAAMALEERAVQFYGDRAASATDPEEKRVYQWLSDWEKTHLTLLAQMDKSLQEAVWYDNQFWPY